MPMTVMAVVAATVNIFMAAYNLGKDVYGFGKEKVGRSKKFENYKENVEWKRKTLFHEKSVVGKNIDTFGTQTIGLYNQWVERVEKADARLHQYLDRCEHAKGFHKRAELGEKGSILAREVEKLEADGRFFYDPRYRTRQSSSVSRQTHKASSFKRSVALPAETSSYISRPAHGTSSDIRSFALPGDESSSSICSWNSGHRSSSSRSCVSVTSSAASRNTGSIGLTGSRDSSRRINSSFRNRGYSSSSSRSCISFPSTAASRNTGSIGMTGSRDSSRSSNRGNVSPTWSTRAVRGCTLSSQLLMESPIRHITLQRTTSMRQNRGGTGTRAERLSALAMPR